MAGWQREAVGQFAIVNDGTAAALAADDRASEARRVLTAIFKALEVTQRKRRFLPCVEPQGGDFFVRGGQQNCFIDGHVPGAWGWRVDDQANRRLAVHASFQLRIGWRAAWTSSGRLIE